MDLSYSTHMPVLLHFLWYEFSAGGPSVFLQKNVAGGLLCQLSDLSESQLNVILNSFHIWQKQTHLTRLKAKLEILVL